MYLSKLKIKNYKSIKELDLEFKSGKNVIVGKNNSGKSNILKAIDLVLGDKAPAYQKTQNITSDDFFGGNTDEPIYIYCELEREEGEPLNYKEMYNNCNGFYVYGTKYGGNKVPERLELKNNEHFYDDLEDNFFSINLDDLDFTQKYYVSKKDSGSYQIELGRMYHFAYIFKASCDEDGKITKDIRFLYRENDQLDWVLSFNALIRNEMIQSAIIPSFRDPNSTLRIADYTWYGKLLKKYISSEDFEFISACDSVKTASNKLFKEIIGEINDSKIDVAFPKTEISIQCSPKNIDAYKMAMIYVNDGFDSLLTEKGSGIQSAVIIGLFDFYTRKVAHVSSSLLAIEEPELYLHPHGRRIISNRLEKYLANGKNQVIITSHSPEFITSVQDNLNLISVNKGQTGETTAHNVYFNDPKNLQIIAKSQNSEVFFADKVMLVEGADKYVIEEYAKKYGVENSLDVNWLDNNNISIIRTNGKSQFSNYVSVLDELNIRWNLMADFDFLREGLYKFLVDLDFDEDYISELSKINSRLGMIDSIDLTQEAISKIDDFVRDIDELNYPINHEKVTNLVKNSMKIRNLDDIPDNDLKDKTNEYIQKLKQLNIYILSGDLESFFTETLISKLRSFGFKKKNKQKEQKIFYTVSTLLKSHDIDDLFKCDEFKNSLDCLSMNFKESGDNSDISEEQADSKI